MSMRRRLLALLAAVAALAVLATGCGGSSRPTAAATRTQNGALAFARCMRSHGLSKWPDPTSSGEFDKSKLRRTGYSVSQVQAAEDGPCNQLLGAASTGPTITPADRTDYLKAAACMRAHGFSNFPDPTFRDGTVQTNIPSSINQDASPFKAAADTCTKLIPAGLPYSRSSHS